MTGDVSHPNYLESQQDVANIMNKHFTNIAEKLSKNLDPPKKTFQAYLGQKNKYSIFLRNIDLGEILQVINKLDCKKSMGFDEIPPELIKWAPHLFSPILKILFNKCIDAGYYPNNF